MTAETLTGEDLAALHDEIEAALRSGDDAGLRILGYGEISLVVGWPAAEPRWAVKRLPVFRDRAAAAAYRGVVERYLARLDERGIEVVPTAVQEVPATGGRVCCYCVQPALDPATLGPSVLRHGGPAAPALVAGVVDRLAAAVGPDLGLDAQISNWVLTDGRPRYLDVTTPLLRDAAGRDLLDTRIFLAALPAALRAPVHRFVVPGIVARYHDPRSVVLDLAANLHKERLVEWIPTVLARANPHLEAPVTAEEVAADYRSDARLWEAMLRVRRLDRWWQRTVRRRPYPFLLPHHVDR